MGEQGYGEIRGAQEVVAISISPPIYRAPTVLSELDREAGEARARLETLEKEYEDATQVHDQTSRDLRAIIGAYEEARKVLTESPGCEDRQSKVAEGLASAKLAAESVGSRVIS